MKRTMTYFIVYAIIMMLSMIILGFTGYWLTSGLLMILLMLTPILFVGSLMRKLLSFVPLISMLSYVSLSYDFGQDAIGTLILYLTPFVVYVLTQRKTLLSHLTLSIHTGYLIVLNVTEIPFFQVMKVYVIFIIYILLLPTQLKHQINALFKKRNA